MTRGMGDRSGREVHLTPPGQTSTPLVRPLTPTSPWEAENKAIWSMCGQHASCSNAFFFHWEIFFTPGNTIVILMLTVVIHRQEVSHAAVKLGTQGMECNVSVGSQSALYWKQRCTF